MLLSHQQLVDVLLGQPSYSSVAYNFRTKNMCDTDKLTISMTGNGEFVALCVASSAVSPIPFHSSAVAWPTAALLATDYG